MISVFYSLTLMLIGIYAVSFGGRTGQAVIGVITALFVASTVATWTIEGDRPYALAMLGIDATSLILKTAIACASTRRWPIVIAAFQLNSVCAQASIMVAPTFAAKYHYAMTTFWAVPTLLVIALGVFLDRRHDRCCEMLDATGVTLQRPQMT